LKKVKLNLNKKEAKRLVYGGLGALAGYIFADQVAETGDRIGNFGERLWNDYMPKNVQAGLIYIDEKIGGGKPDIPFIQEKYDKILLPERARIDGRLRGNISRYVTKKSKRQSALLVPADITTFEKDPIYLELVRIRKVTLELWDKRYQEFYSAVSSFVNDGSAENKQRVEGLFNQLTGRLRVDIGPQGTYTGTEDALPDATNRFVGAFNDNQLQIAGAILGFICGMEIADHPEVLVSALDEGENLITGLASAGAETVKGVGEIVPL